jgi:Holliday junction resolvasome RuvABC endonuclease subunit
LLLCLVFVLELSWQDTVDFNLNTHMIIAGIDYSLRGPAICLYKSVVGKKFSYEDCSFYFLTDNKRQSEITNTHIFGERLSDWNSDEQRYESIADWAVDIVMGCTHIALEGYAFGAHGRVFQIAENTGLLKYKLYQLGIPVTVMSPSEVKKFFVGKGNCDKNVMYSGWLVDTGIDLKALLTPKSVESISPVSDIVDSYAICKKLFTSLNDESKITQED